MSENNPAIPPSETPRTDAICASTSREFDLVVFAQQLERESAALSARVADLQDQLAQERELHVMQMAGISTACLMNTRQSDPPLAKDHPYWTPAYQDAVDAVGREMRERERAEAAEVRLQEATDSALERAAKVCDLAVEENNATRMTHDFSTIFEQAVIQGAIVQAEKLGKSIRSLKGQPK